MSEESHLSESVNPALLEGTIKVILLDGLQTTELPSIHLYTPIRSQFDLDLSQFIPGQPMKIEDFPILLSRLVENAQAREGTVASERVKVLKASQPDMVSDFGEEIITYRILSRKPANMSRDGKSRPNRLPAFSYEHVSSLEPSRYLIVERRILDHELEISAWAKSATLADKRALWLERLLISERWSFVIKGAKPFHFISRSPDTMWNPSARLFQIPTKWFVRLQELTVLSVPTISEINLIADNNNTT
jgi:hypothetical protein